MRPRFSDRLELTTSPTLQLNSMNDALRNSIWNLLMLVVPQPVSGNTAWFDAAEIIAVEFLKKPIDEIPNYPDSRACEWLRSQYHQLQWYEVYNLLEFVVDKAEDLTDRQQNSRTMTNLANDTLARESSGYRFIQGEIVPISTEAEVAALEEAAVSAEKAKLEGVRTHLNTSLKLLGQKPEPDHRNAIKEAISAVESAVKRIVGTKGGGLDKALGELARKTPIHPALGDAFLKLYGYTSDDSGIRHAILVEPTVGFDEAKFMIVACSAFVNFLISKAEAASLLNRTT